MVPCKCPANVALQYIFLVGWLLVVWCECIPSQQKKIVWILLFYNIAELFVSMQYHILFH